VWGGEVKVWWLIREMEMENEEGNEKRKRREKRRKKDDKNGRK
jgi:hypothetical protein